MGMQQTAGCLATLLCCLLAPALASGSGTVGKQLRGERRAQAANATEEVRGPPGAGHCHGSTLGLMLERTAPLCVQACPRVCADAVPLLALNGAGEGAMRDALCAGMANLSCALEPANAEACRPLVALPMAQWMAATCKAAGGGASSLLDEASIESALRARAAAHASTGQVTVDAAAEGKQDDPLCTYAPEGQVCVPKDGGHTDSYIYCSAHKRLSSGATYCPDRRGPRSWCVGSGFGLTKSYCDDPFCRNGGAFAGNGRYCHNNAVVACFGENAPKTVQQSLDQTRYQGNYEITDHYDCVGGFNNARCEFTFSSSTYKPNPANTGIVVR